MKRFSLVWLVVLGTACKGGGQTFSLPPGADANAPGTCTLVCLALLGLADGGKPVCLECNDVVLSDGGPGVFCDNVGCSAAPPQHL